MRKIFVGLFSVILLQSARAGEGACPSFAVPQDVVDCVLKNHPDILRVQAEVSNLEAFSTFAGQRPNPEVSGEVLSNSSPDEAALASEMTYLHTFELGGKRGRRLDRAAAQQKIVLARVQRVQEEVGMATVLNLFRLRHIQAELHAVEEAQHTFGTIVAQYKSRRQLSPEQQVSLNVFLLAQSDYTLRRSGLAQEQGRLKQFFDLATGLKFNEVQKILPSLKTTWPRLSTTVPPLVGAAFKEAQAEMAFAHAELRIADSIASPDLKLGPMAGLESGRGQNNKSLGGALSIDLPLYQRNQGARALAKTDVYRAEVNLNLRERELAAEWETWATAYADVISSLAEMPSIEQMEKKHQGMEDLFERGLVQSALVIEAHRQMTDYTESFNAQELRAIEALWSIYRLEGRALQEKI